MRRGALDRVIDIEHYITTGVSSANEPVKAWKKYREDVFAEVYSKRGVELWSEKDSRRISETITRFRIDYTDAEGIDSEMRINFEGQLYDVKAILPDHDRKQDCVIDAILQSGSVEAPTIQALCEPVLSAVMDEPYQCFITIIGGSAPYTVVMTPGSPVYAMPAGLQIVQASDKVWCLEGYPATAGSYPISITVTDADGQSATIDPFTLTVS